MRQGSVERKTNETNISGKVNLDGTGVFEISSGIGFLDHMLEQFSRHSLIDLKVKAAGDLHIDFHHTTEDTGIVIGEAVNAALGDRAGITRYGSALVPLDEALTRVVVDCSNRPYLIWKVGFSCNNPRYLGGENIAFLDGYYGVNNPGNRNTAITIVDGWMNSPGHRENILTPDWRSEGVGVAVSGDVVYVTQNFC